MPNIGGASTTIAPPVGSSGSASTSVAPDGVTSASVTSAIEQEVTVNLLGGLISPATVEEARPVAGGGVQAFLLRKLARHESRIARLESVQ